MTTQNLPTYEGLARTVGAAPWPLIAAGVVVAVFLAVVAVRAGRRAVRSARRVTLPRVRAVAVLAVGTAGMLAAAYGTVRALVAMGQPVPLALATSAAIEGGAVAFAADLYIQARKPKGDPGRPRVASWAYALASAWANATHPPAGASWTGSLIFGLVPLLGLYLIEYQAHSERSDRTGAAGRRRSSWPARFAGAAWRRGWTALATWLGVDVDATDTETERELAVRRAARATYRLRLAKHANEAAPSRRTGRLVRRWTRKTQAAQERAGVTADQVQAVRMSKLMRQLVDGPEQATGDWRDVAASASRVYGGTLLLDARGPVLDLSGRAAYGAGVNLGELEVNRRGGVVDPAPPVAGALLDETALPYAVPAIASPGSTARSTRPGSTVNGSTSAVGSKPGGSTGSTGEGSTATVTALPGVNPDPVCAAFAAALAEGRMASLGELAAAGGISKQAASKRRRRLIEALDVDGLTADQRDAVAAAEGAR